MPLLRCAAHVLRYSWRFATLFCVRAHVRRVARFVYCHSCMTMIKLGRGVRVLGGRFGVVETIRGSWVGVRLLGERRVDEYPIGSLSLIGEVA